MATRIALSVQLRRKLREMGCQDLAGRICRVTAGKSKGVHYIQAMVMPSGWTFSQGEPPEFTLPRNITLAATTLLAVAP